MKIICGLGNPGRQYETTHHNMGFLTVDEIAGRLGVAVNKLKFKALMGEINLFGEKIILVKPQTFMNNSGEAVREVMNFYKADPKDLFVIYDDIDIKSGSIRVRASGSSGSHNGMKSVIYQLQSDAFPRCRIGIGGEKDTPIVNYVLSQVSDQEAPLLQSAISKAADAAIVWAQYGIKAAMDFANVSDETRKKSAEKKEKVIRTERLIIRPMNPREIEKLSEETTDEGLKEICLERISGEKGGDYGMWSLRLSEGGKNAGTAYLDGDKKLRCVILPEYAFESFEREVLKAFEKK
ncbi:MAG: aminoacyl-tRNA hydrolase [Firmicutes bacterium]|nr:aminoacyl-tRNA hydrolase [Bacillota bacterium]